MEYILKLIKIEILDMEGMRKETRFGIRSFFTLTDTLFSLYISSLWQFSSCILNPIPQIIHSRLLHYQVLFQFHFFLLFHNLFIQVSHCNCNCNCNALPISLRHRSSLFLVFIIIFFNFNTWHWFHYNLLNFFLQFFLKIAFFWSKGN